MSEVTKIQWKQLIERKINEKNKSDLLHQIRGYQKLDYDKLCHEKYEVKEYIKTLNPAQGRQYFAIRSNMCRTIKQNFSSDKNNAALMWQCQHCPAIDSQSHIRWCRGYLHLREGIDLTTDKGIVSYFQAVIKFREEKG